MIRMNFAKEADLKKANEERFQTTLDKFKNQLQISSAVVMVDILNWNNARQILSDLISSKDGMPFKKDNLRKVTKDKDGAVQSVEEQFVKVYFMGAADFVYPSVFPQSAPPDQTIPRYGIGAFVHAFKELFKHYHGYEAELIEYGKPFLKHMQFVESYILSSHPNVKNIYAIGDNLLTDVRGGNAIAANNKGQAGLPKWVSIAVKSGIFKDSEKDRQDIQKDKELKPMHIVEDFEAAVKLIQDLE